MSLTTDPNDQCLKDGKKEVGQNSCYLILSEEERAKGFVRPVRTSYVHVGRKIEFPYEIEYLSPNDLIKYEDQGWIAMAKNTDRVNFSSVGIFLTNRDLKTLNKETSRTGGCGVTTSMGLALSETYARNPSFYGATFCTGCNKHLPVGEFLWDGTDQVVGS